MFIIKLSPEPTHFLNKITNLFLINSCFTMLHIQDSKLYPRFLLFIGLMLPFFPLYSYANSSQTASKNILVVHSYHKGFTWTDNIDIGLNQILASPDCLINCKIYHEYLDAKRFNLTQREQGILHSWQLKYSNLTIDVIITSDDDAFQLMLTHREQFKPNIPIVFCGVNNYPQYITTILTNQHNYTSVTEGFDLAATLNAAVTMLPNTNTVYIINDTSTTGLANKHRFELVKPQLKGNNSYVFLENLSMESLEKQVSTLPKNSFLLLLTYNKDALNQYYDYETLGKIISRAANVPVFVVWDFYLGTGVTGGKVVSGVEQGRMAANIASRILRGTPADSIPVVTESPNKFLFDYQQTQKFGLNAAILNQPVTYLNKPENLINRYRTEITIIVLAFILLTITIIILIIINRKKAIAERRLRVSKRKILSIIENSNQGFAELDNLNRIVYANARFCQIFECHLHQVLSHYLYQIIPEPNFPALLNAIEECQQHNTATHETSINITNSVTKYVVFSLVNAPVERTTDKAIFLFVNDISRLKANETELIRAKEKAEASDKLKSAFLANMSHEIRTPMNAILGFSELLTHPDVDDISRTLYINTIQTSGHALMALINDILDISKIAAGQLSIFTNPVILKSVFDNLYITFTEYRKSINKEHIALEAEPCCETMTILTDNFRLNQILSNLLNNAFKFTEQGTIKFGCKPQSKNEFLFYVSDTGIGFPKEMETTIFERFIKIENLNNQVYRGAGLGLSISKNLVELLGGKIWCESTEGKGTTFYFTIKTQEPLG